MAHIDSKMAQLRRKAFAGEIEVEDLVEMAVLRDARAVPLIKDLWSEFDWPRSNDKEGVHVVPFGRWAEVVCVYLEGGFKALIEYAVLPERESVYFATSIMAEIKTLECAQALAQLSVRLKDVEIREPRAPYNLASAINLVLSFKDAPAVTGEAAVLLRKFLHELLSGSTAPQDQALVICALRGIGDDEAVAIITALPELGAPYIGLRASACKAIRKNQRRS